MLGVLQDKSEVRRRAMRFVITAGPTREYIDAVRFLSNPSTGKMGFAIAEAAAKRGHEVVLIAGPVVLKTPAGVRRVDVVSAREMLKAVCAECRPGTVLAGVAAVADFRPKISAKRKLHKGEMPGAIELVPNPDVLASVKTKGVVKVGFAAETDDVLASAADKCRRKNLRMIVANDVSRRGIGFGADDNEVAFLFPDGAVERLPKMTKRAVARRIVERIESWF